MSLVKSEENPLVGLEMIGGPNFVGCGDSPVK